MSKKKSVFLILFSLLLVFTIFIVKDNFKSSGKIDKILKSEPYSYLSKAAQAYVKDVYEKTGEIILTEKNKKENVPYLNPQYAAYLQLSNEQKKNISLIPNTYNVDYTFTSEGSSEELPKTYNLENVDGKNYTSPMYNQGRLGTCWAFATVENAESHLMIKKNEPRNDNSTRFSVRQMDYAASTNGIRHYENPWGAAPLGLGGNFVFATTLMANGLTLVDDAYMPYDETLDEKSLYEIHNYSNSMYEVDGTVNLPKFGRTSAIITEQCNNVDDYDACYDKKEEEAFQEYIKIIKEGIMNYGGIYVGTHDPTGQCGALNTDGYYVLDPNHVCFPMGSTAPAETGHAMQIIGWDDSYKYSYCKENPHSSTTDGACTSGTLEQGTGAWLVKNSWGESDAGYIYLTYTSIKSNFVSFAYITSLTDMKDKNWDNVYNNGLVDSTFTKKLTETFEKKHDNQEKIQKIKFHTLLMNQQYNISIKINENTYLIADSYQTKYPGLYTVDVSDKDIYVGQESFDVVIVGSERSINNNSISVFTKNMYSKQLIITEEEKNIDSNNFTIYSETRNIPSNTQIEYELYDDTKQLENVIQVNDNIVSANNINTEISLIEKIEPGIYKLVQKIGNTKATTVLNIGTILEGAGTIESPYKIHTEEELKYIHNHLNYNYELANDIELTEEWIPIGTKENPFTGSFDGKNHKIVNLKINDSTLEYAGLFGYVKDSNEHKTYIRNIYLINPNIVAKQYVGGLIGGININQSGENTALIDSIYIIGGSIKGEFANGLVADISGYKNLIINNIFSSATIEGNSYSSLIRFSSNQYNSNNGTSISNIENIGVMLDNNRLYDNTSIINADYSYYYSISNYISTGYSKKNISLNQFYDTPIHNTDYNYKNNGYALARSDSTYEFPSNIEKVNDITELKNIEKYSDWGESFNSYWKFDEKDGIKRIPVLKGVDLDYTNSINNINVEFGTDISLSDYISSELITRRLTVTTDDNDIIKISKKYNYSEAYPYEIIISPLKSGKATVHIVSDYDGFEENVTITVNKSVLKIKYHNDLDTMTQGAANGSTMNLANNTFTKKGYKFKEWNTKEDGSGITYTDGQEITITDDLDLYAQWLPIEYKVIFYANDGKEATISQQFNYDRSNKLLKNTFTRAGYKFKEWNTNKDGSGTTYIDEQEVINLKDIENSNFELYAQWTKEIYTLSFDANGGIGSMKNQSFTFDMPFSLNRNTFTKDGYIFKEWNTKSDGTGTSYTDGQTISASENITLYAIWKNVTGTIVYNSNYSDNQTKTQTFTFNTDTQLDKNTFTRTGYIFKEWNTKVDGTGTSYTDGQTISASEDITLYAIWKNVTGTIVYNSNYSDNQTKTQTFTFNTDTQLDKNTFARTGYIFKEWNTKSDGTGESYTDGQTINVSKDITLYAIWKNVTGTIVYNSNYGNNQTKTQTFTFNTDTQLDKNTFTRTGYMFKEWNTKVDGTGTSYTDKQTINRAESLILFAIWEESYDYVINNYEVDETNKYISKIMVNTEVNKFAANISLNYGYGIDVDTKTINNKKVLYTGGKTRITKELNLYREYTNVVIGDINGDGAINSADLLKIRQHLLGTNILTGAYFLSSDINYDNTINSADLLRVRQHLLGTKPIE